MNSRKTKDRFIIFNPEHDLALADGLPHFVPPASAVTFAEEAALLPLWIYGRGAVVAKPLSQSFQAILVSLDIDIQIVNEDNISSLKNIEIAPWGWDLLVREKLLKLGIEEKNLPSLLDIDNIKELSNRKLALKAHIGIIKDWPFTATLPKVATLITQVVDIKELIYENRNLIMKMPWSGSGKGLRFCKERLTPHDEGWLKNVIEKQGAAVVEKRYNVVQNFALEFCIHNHKVNFCGYSLFFTKNGAYEGNELLSDEALLSKLNAYIPKNYIIFCQDFYADFLQNEVAPFYEGFVGVDMFVYNENGQYHLHPACEINIRTTMGILAHEIEKNYIDENSEGVLLTSYSNKYSQLIDNLKNKSDKNPLVISNGKIISGVLPLIEVNEKSHYSIWIEINTND